MRRRWGRASLVLCTTSSFCQHQCHDPSISYTGETDVACVGGVAGSAAWPRGYENSPSAPCGAAFSSWKNCERQTWQQRNTRSRSAVAGIFTARGHLTRVAPTAATKGTSTPPWFKGVLRIGGPLELNTESNDENSTLSRSTHDV